MSKYIWESGKERQVWYLNLFFSKRNRKFNKDIYRLIKNIFESDSGISLNDLEVKARKRIIMQVFHFKLESSFSNAKYVRAGKKKGYENVEFKLGDWSSLFKNLKKYRPDLVETGMNICEEYIKNGFNKDYALVVHRKHDSGHYAWDNIEIITRKEHDALTKQERQMKKELSTIN